MIGFVLENTTRIMAYMVPFPAYAKKFLKALLQFWGKHEQQTVRVNAYHNIRRLAMVMPGDFLDLLMKGLYLTYARGAKFLNVQSKIRIDFMALCIVEIYSMDHAAAYQHAFVYIRQLAIDLRQSLTKKTKENFEKIYSWQYINCLRLWARLLTSHLFDSKTLGPLLYPLIQIIIGTITLLPTPSFFPLRLHGCALLNEITRSSKNYVPVAPILLEVFQWTALTRKAKSSTAKPPELGFRLKCSKSMLETRSCQDVLLAATIQVLTDHLNIFSRNVAFPELVVPTVIALKALGKKTHIERLRSTAKRLIEKIDANSRWVAGHRAQLDCAPKDTEKLANFLEGMPESPLAKYVASLPQQMLLTSGGSHGGEETSDEEDEEEPKKQQKKGKKRAREEEEVEDLEEPDDDDGDDDGDLVRDLQFSDDDE